VPESAQCHIIVNHLQVQVAMSQTIHITARTTTNQDQGQDREATAEVAVVASAAGAAMAVGKKNRRHHFIVAAISKNENLLTYLLLFIYLFGGVNIFYHLSL